MCPHHLSLGQRSCPSRHPLSGSELDGEAAFAELAVSVLGRRAGSESELVLEQQPELVGHAAQWANAASGVMATTALIAVILASQASLLPGGISVVGMTQLTTVGPPTGRKR